MIDKVRKVISKYGMIESGDSVVVGVSGGADSVALLHVLLSLRDEYGLKIMAAHLNHRLRGEESDRDENFTRELCKRLHVDFVSEPADVAGFAKSRGFSLEEAGREARYAFFSRCCSGKNAEIVERDQDCGSGGSCGNANIQSVAGAVHALPKLAVAHNLNDSVETMLLNLARGTALRGLCGIPPTRVSNSHGFTFRIIRPLIECGRGEIEVYCEENGLDFVVDSTNLSDDFARNRIRHYALPALLSVNEGFWFHAAETLEALRLDADYLDELVEDTTLDVLDNKAGSTRGEYLALAHPLRYRVLTKMLLKNQIPVDSARLARLDAIAKAGSGAEQLSDKLYFKADKHGIYVQKAHKQVGPYHIYTSVPKFGETVEIVTPTNKTLRLMNTDYENYEENIKYIGKDLKNVLDCDRIGGSLSLRQKLPADSIRIAGRNCTKTLRKLFQEAKLTYCERERVLVIADDAGVVWVEGFGVAERVAVSPKSKNILLLEVK